MCKYQSSSLSDMRNHYVSSKHRFVSVWWFFCVLVFVRIPFGVLGDTGKEQQCSGFKEELVQSFLLSMKTKLQTRYFSFQRYLNLQLILGHEKFCQFYSNTPLPGIYTNSQYWASNCLFRTWGLFLWVSSVVQRCHSFVRWESFGVQSGAVAVWLPGRGQRTFLEWCASGRFLFEMTVKQLCLSEAQCHKWFSLFALQEIHRRMLLYTGWINKGVCKVTNLLIWISFGAMHELLISSSKSNFARFLQACEKSLFLTWDGNSFNAAEWVQHVSGRSHAKVFIHLSGASASHSRIICGKKWELYCSCV